VSKISRDKTFSMSGERKVDRNRIWIKALFGLTALLSLAGLAWGGGARAGGPVVQPGDFKPTNTSWAPVSAGTIPRLCGELVYLHDKRSGVKGIGLKVCNSAKIYIFYRHPRDLVRYYQFRDANVGTGPKLCDMQYGCLDKYLIGFKNYVGLESCDNCGKLMLPTWTAAPLTPYTPTPLPPTATLYQPSPTASFTPTLAPWQVTETPQLFELLRGTTAAPSAMPSLTPAAASVTPSPGPGEPASALERFSGSPLFLGLIFLVFGLLLAFLAWRSVTRPDHE